MSKNWYKDIVKLHRKVMKDNFPTTPYIPDKKLQALRTSLIQEEIDETIWAIIRNDLPQIADRIVDSIVVLIGTAVTYGIDIRPVWNEVHKTNMAKISGDMRADGKLLKPEGWQPPDTKRLLLKQGMKYEDGN